MSLVRQINTSQAQIHLAVSQIRWKGDYMGKDGMGRRGGVQGSSAAMAYRLVMADRIGYWGNELAAANAHLQGAHKHLQKTIEEVSVPEEARDKGSNATTTTTAAPRDGFELFCWEFLQENPLVVKAAMDAADAAGVSTTREGEGVDWLRYATSWLLATLVAQFDLLSPQDAKRYLTTQPLDDKRTTAISKRKSTVPRTGTTQVPRRKAVPETSRYQSTDVTKRLTSEEEESRNKNIASIPANPDLLSAYQDARLELERRQREDLEGIVMYALSKTEKLLMHARQSNRTHGDALDAQNGGSDSFSTVLGVDLGDVRQYPSVGFNSFSPDPHSQQRSSTNNKGKMREGAALPDGWATALADLIKGIPTEWAGLSREAREEYAPDAQQRRQRQEILSRNRADRQEAQRIIDANLDRLKKEAVDMEKQRLQSSKRKGKKKGSSNAGGAGGGDCCANGHNDALQWLLGSK